MKPYVTIKVSDKYIAERLGLKPYFDTNGNWLAQGYVDTYKKVKQNLQRYLDNSTDNIVEVTRSRRGEWGEWFERWEKVNGKKKITKQTWL